MSSAAEDAVGGVSAPGTESAMMPLLSSRPPLGSHVITSFAVLCILSTAVQSAAVRSAAVRSVTQHTAEDPEKTLDCWTAEDQENKRSLVPIYVNDVCGADELTRSMKNWRVKQQGWPLA